MPVVRSAGDRLGRLPLSGGCADRRRVTYRPGVREIAGPRTDASGRGSAQHHAAGVHLSPLRMGRLVAHDHVLPPRRAMKPRAGSYAMIAPAVNKIVMTATTTSDIKSI